MPALQFFSSFLILLLLLQPYRAHGSSPASPPGGLCKVGVLPHGYKCQEFEVTTKDGYILSMQRIPEGRVGGVGGSTKQPVLLQHGVLVDGLTWLLNSPDQSLGFILADSGFDVWIANTRGTRFSRRHANLDAARAEYWNWSWDELAAYDLPATFDFVFQQTGQKINYVGHSLGTLVTLASLSQGNIENLKSAALLSPVAYLSHMTTPLGILAARSFVGEVFTSLGISEFNPKGQQAISFLNALCANRGINCYDLMTAFTGKNCCLNGSTVDFFLNNEPQSTSTKNMVHLSQTVRDRVLSKYNYENAAVNLVHYGQAIPPVYTLSNIPKNIPLFISYGGRDALADVQDVLQLLDDLKLHDEDKLTVHFVKNYAHADFIMAVSAKEIVYDALVSFFKRQ